MSGKQVIVIDMTAGSNIFFRGGLHPLSGLVLVVALLAMLLGGCAPKTAERPVEPSVGPPVVAPVPQAEAPVVPEPKPAGSASEYIGISLAVLTFENNTPIHKDRYDFLANWFSVRLSEVLGLQPTLRLVERNRIDQVLEELERGTNELADQRTSLKIGKLVGAQYFVFGNFFVVEPTLYCTARIVDAQNGQVVKAEEAVGSVFDLTGVVDRINNAVLEGLGQKIRQTEYRRSGSRDSALVAKLYLEGTALMKDGARDDALEKFTEILKLDKNNWWARKRIQEILAQ